MWKKENDKFKIDNSLIGTWVETVNATPSGYYVHELVFNNDLTFSDKSSSYGIYSSQGKNELSGWFIRTGNYDINNDKLNFISKKNISWDSFYGGSPVTVFKTQIIYENCSFKLNGDKLELNYTTYPADAPENTIRLYERQND